MIDEDRPGGKPHRTSLVTLLVAVLVVVAAVVVILITRTHAERQQPVKDRETTQQTPKQGPDVGEEDTVPPTERPEPGGPVGPEPEIPEGEGIISAVTMTSATNEPGGTVVAQGTIDMPGDKKGDVAISVSWVNPDTAQVYARGLTTLLGVEPGEHCTWAVKAELPAGAQGAATVLGAVIVE
jgi:cytoskeletal protein RodZ